MFRVDDPRSEPRVLHELRKKKMAEDAESDIAIRFVDENDYREISAKAVSAKWKLKKNCPSWLVSKHCYDVDSSEAESSSEEDEKVSASEEEAVTETESANEIQENVESSCSDDSSADEAKMRNCAGKPKPAPSSATVTKSSKKAPKKSTKWNKSLSEEKMERLSFPDGRRLISLQYSGMLSISLRFKCLSPDMFYTAFSHAKPPRNVHAACEVTLTRF